MSLPARAQRGWRDALRRRRWGWAAGLAGLLGGVLATVPAAPTALAQDDGRFLRQRLALEHELESLFSFDLDGDGRKELVVLEADRGHSRDIPYTVRVFRQAGQGFTPLPGARARLPLHVSLAGVARFREGPALAMLLPGEVVLWPWQDGRFAPEAARRRIVDSIFPVANGELKAGLRWLADLSGSGTSEILVPRFDGVEVLGQYPDGTLRRLALLGTRADARILDWFRRDMVAYELPALAVRQVDGRGWQDVALYLDGQLWVFLLDGTVAGGEVSPALLRDLQPPEPFDPEKPRDPPLRLVATEDLNADGHFDLMFTKNDAADSQFNTKTHVLVHYGQPGSGGTPIDFSSEPDQAYFTEGFSLPLVLDVNADGRRDMVLVNVEIGFWTVIKALITRSVSADAAFYLMPAEGRYPRDPQHIEDYSVTFSLGRYSHQPIADFGDLNGDGLPDLLLSESKETIGIHWGRGDRVWPSDPDVTLEDFVPTQGSRVRIEDLDGDGRDDLLFAYNRTDIRLMPEVNRAVTVLRSRYGEAATAAAAAGTAVAAPPAKTRSMPAGAGR